MRRYVILLLVLALLIESALLFWQSFYFTSLPRRLVSLVVSDQQGLAPVAITSPFYYVFNTPGKLSEASQMSETWSPYWWLNSGGNFNIENGVGKTVQGELPKFSQWRIAYALSNPEDTDGGYHPQNIFRLVSRSKWRDSRQEVYFRIVKDNVSASPNRNASNGLLLFMRYQDGDDLYYAGIRVDGAAVIKKKINGDYFTIGYKKIWEGEYERNSKPSLLPKNTWIGLRDEIKTNPDGTVTIRLYIDEGKTGKWKLALEGKDDGKNFGGAPIAEGGYGGIRTDFMDVEFSSFRLEDI